MQIKYSLRSTHDTDLQKKLKSLYILKVLTKSETGCDIFKKKLIEIFIRNELEFYTFKKTWSEKEQNSTQQIHL